MPDRAQQDKAYCAIPDDTTLRCRNVIWECIWQDLWSRVGWCWAEIFSLLSSILVLWQRRPVTNAEQYNAVSFRSVWLLIQMVRVQGLTLDAKAVFQQHWRPVSVSHCRRLRRKRGGAGRGKKPPLNGFSCLVKHSSRGGTLCDDKQRHAPFLLFHLHSQATAQPVTSKGQIASRYVLTIFSCPLSTVHNTNLLGHDVKRNLANQWLHAIHMCDLALQIDPLFHIKQPHYTILHLFL